ncbi:S8 family serine peptidase [Mucilaginibacter frigoritolerans]|uniref:S8 family serine peptidase n=1 Tax=Mucilaginibacter frigoritolerans TaxID=652788 RepID=UPI00147750FE|nr:S8 family serine peptidase [Mucilaginibacter frigoritolerans]
MSKLFSPVAGLLLLLCISAETYGQQVLVTEANKKELQGLSSRFNNLFLNNHQKALGLANIHGWPVVRKTKMGKLVLLQGVNSLGFPVYLVTDNNVIAAATTGTNSVQPGGILGLNLSGSSNIINNKLAIWDGGAVYKGHQEFTGKTITIEDTVSILDHSTHVAGTMVAKGIYAPAKGMAFNATTLHSYYFDNDITKMSSAASNLLLSNHSYGDVAGWDFNDLANRWEWYGLPGDTVDYNFGFYGQRTQQWDQIAFNAPYYLIVESAGNAHAYPGPAVGSDYYGYASASNQTLVDKGPRPASISSNTGYDVISTTGNAKNILTVGAVNPLPYGPATSSSISIASFSSWGPTDDGRIKPDIVGDGVDVLSAGTSGPQSYITMSGTSMSAPNITGSLYLLQEYYAEKNGGSFMRAATLKGLACHTAVDAGNTGPDYIYGWGLLNTGNAAQVITNNGSKSIIKESILQQGQQQTYNVIASGDGILSATISWTDPMGTQTPDGTVNSRTPKLVNDLDIRISDGTVTFMPWILDPNNPSAIAKTGDNIVDNIEQVYIAGAVPGKAYTITVSHKGTLTGGSQAYSLIATGIGGTAYCTSAPLSNADSRINNVTLANINYTPVAGCTSYTNLTNLTVQLEQGKTYPLSLTLGTCSANFNKAAKVFIDWNGNGVFDANELVATTSILNTTGTYNTNITVPASVIAGNYSLMRVVLNETSDTSTIKACGTYGKGETQDYRVQFLQSTTDAGVIAIVSPDSTGSCSSATQVTVTLKNFGSATINNIPVTVTVTAPDNTTTTLQQTYTGSLAPLEQEDFTLNGTFNAIAGATYHITATSNLPGDPNTSNNQVSETVLISLPPSASDLTAYYCNNSNQYQLSGSGDSELLWYQNITDNVPIAFGATALTSKAPVNNTYYAGVNDFSGTVGPATKTAFSGGGYNQFTPSINVSANIPVIIESARLYVGNSGKVTFQVANTNGEIVSQATINAVATSSHPQPSAQADDPNDQGVVYNLNLLLPAAGAYTITAVFDSTATLYRSNAGVTGYPFSAGDVFSITGNTATSSTDTTYYKGFYYYFYDIKLKSAGCASTARQAVIVSNPVITQNGAVLSSNFSSGNQWYLDGAPIAGATNATYRPIESGNYQTKINLVSGCQLISNTLYDLVQGSSANNTDIGLVLFPVPANSQLNILFVAKTSSNLTLSLINAAGKIVSSSSQIVAAGNFNTALDVSNQSPGTYILKLILGEKTYNNKIIIAR